MPFDMKRLTPAAKFFWPGDPSGEEWVELRLISNKEKLQMIKEVGLDQKTTFKANPFKETIDKIDYVEASLEKGAAFLHLQVDRMIVSWNLKTPEPNSKSIPCTVENKIDLYTGSIEFGDWVDECMKKLEADHKADKERKEKN